MELPVFYACCGRPSEKDKFQKRQAEQGVAGGDQVVSHDAEAVLDVLVEIAGRLRLGDVEDAEKGEGGSLPEQGVGRQQQHQPEGDDFIPDDAAVVGVADSLAGSVDDPDAEQVGDGEQGEQQEVAGEGPEDVETEPREQRAESAGRPRRQAATTAEGDEMRRVGEQELEAGAGFGGFSQSGRSLAG